MLNPEDRTRSCATEMVCRDCGRTYPLLDTAFRCHGCGNGLDIDYDYELAKKRLSEIPPAEREINIWRFEELLPITDARAQARRATSVLLTTHCFDSVPLYTTNRHD